MYEPYQATCQLLLINDRCLDSNDRCLDSINIGRRLELQWNSNNQSNADLFIFLALTSEEP